MKILSVFVTCVVCSSLLGSIPDRDLLCVQNEGGVEKSWHGERGPRGKRGKRGKRGASGLPGSQGPVGATGATGSGADPAYIERMFFNDDLEVTLSSFAGSAIPLGSHTNGVDPVGLTYNESGRYVEVLEGFSGQYLIEYSITGVEINGIGASILVDVLKGNDVLFSDQFMMDSSFRFDGTKHLIVSLNGGDRIRLLLPLPAGPSIVFGGGGGVGVRQVSFSMTRIGSAIQP